MTALIHEPESRAAGAGTTGLPALSQDFHIARDRLVRDRLVPHDVPLVHDVASRVGTGLPPHVELADLDRFAGLSSA